MIEIENKKRTYAKANNYDFERAYFVIDTYRKGHFDKEDVS